MGQGSFRFSDKEFSFINKIQTHYRAFTTTLRHTTHSRDPSGGVISPTQTPELHKTQHAQEADFHATGGIRTRKLSIQRPQTHALDRAATGIGFKCLVIHFNQ